MIDDDKIFIETRKNFNRMSIRDKFICLAKLKYGDLDYESIAGDIGMTRIQVLKIANMSIRRLHRRTVKWKMN